MIFFSNVLFRYLKKCHKNYELHTVYITSVWPTVTLLLFLEVKVKNSHVFC